jgi:hypothetical protein
MENSSGWQLEVDGPGGDGRRRMTSQQRQQRNNAMAADDGARNRWGWTMAEAKGNFWVRPWWLMAAGSSRGRAIAVVATATGGGVIMVGLCEELRRDFNSYGIL